MFKVGDEVLIKGKVENIEGYGMAVYVSGLGKSFFKEEELDIVGKTYEQGLADAWELAKKICALKNPEFDKVFGCVYFSDAFYNFTPEEALSKIEAYEKEKEIKPTDIVEYDGKNWVVTEVYKGEYSIWNGKKVIHTANVKKVGTVESIKPLEELLRQIGE